LFLNNSRELPGWRLENEAIAGFAVQSRFEREKEALDFSFGKTRAEPVEELIPNFTTAHSPSFHGAGK
jgi:hypothetical protein